MSRNLKNSFYTIEVSLTQLTQRFNQSVYYTSVYKCNLLHTANKKTLSISHTKHFYYNRENSIKQIANLLAR